MTTIAVTTPEGRITREQRALLAESLTDAVLEVEVGRLETLARAGFQVRFEEQSRDTWGYSGRLLSEPGNDPDVMVIDVVVMDGEWSRPTRARVIGNLLAAMAKGLGMEAPSDTWWVQFRVIEEGSWGSRGGVLSILDLLHPRIFSEKRIAEIRAQIQSRVP